MILGGAILAVGLEQCRRPVFLSRLTPLAVRIGLYFSASALTFFWSWAGNVSPNADRFVFARCLRFFSLPTLLSSASGYRRSEGATGIVSTCSLSPTMPANSFSSTAV